MYQKRASRLRAIEEFLSANSGRPTAADLARMFGVSERTVYSDISRLKEAGAPVEGIPGRGGGLTFGKKSACNQASRVVADDAPKVFGYASERRRLRELADSALEGQPSAVIIIGELGSGKSFLTRDLIRHAEAMGFTALLGHSLERFDAPAYWPWASVLDGVSSLRVPRALARRFHRSVEILEQAFPIASQSNRVRARFRDALSRGTELEVHEAGRLVVETAAHLRPLLIAIEDIHWADPGSLQLVHHLIHSVESGSLLIMATVRSPLEEIPSNRRDVLGKILACSRAVAITLESISEDEARRLMRSVSTPMPPESVAKAAYQLSEGNPFFMREISLLLNHRQDIKAREPGHSLAIPVSVKFAIEERLRTVDQRALPALRPAAVLGRDLFTKELLVACDKLAVADPPDALTRAITSGVLTTSHEGARLRFTHELIRQVIYESIEPPDLPRYHAAAGAAIERHRGERASQQPSELARHFWLSRSIDGFEKYAHYAVLAALEALGSDTTGDVGSRFEAILGLPVDQVAARDRALAWFGLGKARWLQTAGSSAASDISAANCYARAFSGLLESGDVESALMVAADGSQDYLDPNTANMLRDAQRLAEPGSQIAARIDLRIAMTRYFSGQESGGGGRETSLELNRILHLARRMQDSDLERSALTVDARIRVDLLDLQNGIDRALHCLAISEARGQLAEPADPHFQLSRAYASMGDLALSNAHAAALLKTSGSLKHNVLTSQWHAMAWSTAICAGDWDTGMSALESMGQWAKESRVSVPVVDNGIRILEAYLNSMTATRAGQDVSWYSLIESPSYPLPSMSDPAQVKAVIALRTREAPAIDLAHKLLLAPPSPNLNVAVRHMGPFHRLGRDCALGIHAAMSGDTGAARALYGRLSKHSGLFAGVLSAPLSVDRVLGLLAGALGRTRVAARHFESAASSCESGGFQPELAHTLFDHARLVCTRSGAASLDAAANLLERSRKVAQAIHMTPLVSEIDEAIAQIAGRGPANTGNRHGLSDREAHVLRLIADGKRNQEIAECLFISVNTVQYHVRNILRKTGAPNRAGAAALSVTDWLSGRQSR